MLKLAIVSNNNYQISTNISRTTTKKNEENVYFELKLVNLTSVNRTRYFTVVYKF